MDYESDFEDGFVETSLGALHFMHHPGTKSKIIFLHGFSGYTKVWKRLVGFLPNNFDVFLIDLLGHGKSDAPTIDYSIESHFTTIKEFVSLQKCEKSYLFGHSYGGWIAAYYAAQHCKCSGIILEDSAGLKENFDTIIQGGVENYKDTMLKYGMSVVGNKEYVLKSIIDSNLKEGQLTKEMLSKVETRTKIIWGSEDKMVDKKYADLFQKYIKGSTLDFVNGAGHDPHSSNPKEVSDIITNFIF
jgi:pimeloyl-ACP methyl ester carboxylesterase